MTVPSKTFVVMLCAILGMTIAGVQTIPGWIKSKYATASSDELNAMVRIAQADTFCFGGTGIAAAPSPADIMFEHVFFSPKAADLFAWAFEHGTPQGQMFALLGLRHLAPPTVPVIGRSPFSFVRSSDRVRLHLRQIICEGGFYSSN